MPAGTRIDSQQLARPIAGEMIFSFDKRPKNYDIYWCNFNYCFNYFKTIKTNTTQLARYEQAKDNLNNLEHPNSSSQSRATFLSNHLVNKITITTTTMIMIISMFQFESIKCSPMPGSFLDSGHAISCKKGQPVEINDYIPFSDPILTRCYSCSCPDGQIKCARVDEARECMLPVKSPAGATSATKHKLPNRFNQNHPASGGFNFEQQNQHQQASISKSQPPIKTKTINNHRKPKQAAAMPSASSGPVAQPIGAKPKSARAKPFIEHVKATVGVSGDNNEVPNAAPTARPHLDELLRAPSLPSDDPRHHSLAAAALGLKTEEFIRKRHHLLQRLQDRTSTTTIQMSTTKSPPPTTTTTDITTTTTELDYTEPEHVTDHYDGPDNGFETDLITTMTTQTTTTIAPIEQDSQTTEPPTGSIITANQFDPTNWPFEPSNSLLERGPTAVSTTSQTNGQQVKGTGINQDNGGEIINPTSDIIEQVSNDGMLFIAMAIEFTILLLIIALIIVFYIFRDAPEHDDETIHQHQRQPRRSPSLDKS